jgi:hypothetical protein
MLQRVTIATELYMFWGRNIFAVRILELLCPSVHLYQPDEATCKRNHDHWNSWTLVDITG